MKDLHKKKEACALRREGHTLLEISDQLDISKSTASLWVRGVSLSQDAQQRISQKCALGRLSAARTHQKNADAKVRDARIAAEKILSGVHLNADTARLLCALLYWCEGTKIRKRSTFCFTNSDPKLVAVFMKLFRAGFPVNEQKLRLNVHLHEYHDPEAQLRFWAEIATIPLEQCHRPYQKPHTAVRTREGYQGCASIRYYDTDLARNLESVAIVFLEKQLGP